MVSARALSRALASALVVTSFAIGSASGAGAADVERARCDRPIPEIFESASPAVVLITAQSINPYRLQNRVTHLLGSGFIFDSDGLVLTNSHVVFGMQSIAVTLDDGSVVRGRLVGADPIFDLAVVRIPKPDRGELPILPLGDSDRVRPGEEIIAIGNPLGLDQTVTRGIVSAVNRLLPETPLSLQEPLIQTDAPINPGNSGGPLLDHCGEVIGITSSIITDAQNIGFAIPVNLAKALVPTLVEHGRVIRPWIGFHGQLVDAEIRKLLLIPMVDGLLVEAVEPGSPAEKAGIRGGSVELSLGGASFLLGGDIAVEIDGVKMSDGDKLASVMRGLAVGKKLKVRLYREGNYRDVEYTLPERPLLPGDIPSQDGQGADWSDRGAAKRLSGRR
ncbi:MAG: trypsin-like peptidase domain-containing protein [Burkholderiales bacterium]|nr:trypsin-like peptidase domain-containing protein [Burkholderiales bacterium]